MGHQLLGKLHPIFFQVRAKSSNVLSLSLVIVTVREKSGEERKSLQFREDQEKGDSKTNMEKYVDESGLIVFSFKKDVSTHT